MVKTIIDTNILDNNGQVTDESERVILEIQDKMNTEDLTVRMPEEEVQQLVHQQSLQKQTVYQHQVVDWQPCQQSNNVPKADNKIPIYNPNGFVKFIMWMHTVFYIILGTFLVFGGAFICGAMWFAGGLMMCPKINVTMKFWPRFGLMILLLAIGCFLI